VLDRRLTHETPVPVKRRVAEAPPVDEKETPPPLSAEEEVVDQVPVTATAGEPFWWVPAPTAASGVAVAVGVEVGAAVAVGVGVAVGTGVAALFASTMDAVAPFSPLGRNVIVVAVLVLLVTLRAALEDTVPAVGRASVTVSALVETCVGSTVETVTVSASSRIETSPAPVMLATRVPPTRTGLVVPAFHDTALTVPVERSRAALSWGVLLSTVTSGSAAYAAVAASEAPGRTVYA
jgi:hypothetical protein